MNLPVVSFYILPQTTQDDRELFVCRLVEKAFKHGMKIHILTPSTEVAHRLDALLWSFRPDSFLPHVVIGTHTTPAPITISFDNTLADSPDLVVNLSDRLPSDLSKVSRFSEVVVQDTVSLEKSRQMYTAYKQLGCRIETHKL